VLFGGYFDTISDPRIERTRLHPLREILAIALCATICGADTWNDIEEFGQAKQEWFSAFLHLEHGIPSHDTFNRVFTRIDPEQFQACFLDWIQNVTELTQGQVVAIDGKTLRKSYDDMDGKAAIHMVSAWASANHLVLGQVKVEAKSNEITAIPALLQAIEVAGCIVTIDAMGCQKAIAATIMKKEADYVLAVKENQLHLYAAIVQVFADKCSQGQPVLDLDTYRTEDQGHGRREVRTTWTTNDLSGIPMREEWAGLVSIGLVIAERTHQGKTSTEKRYYISSLPSNAERIGCAARAHWSIENNVHWVLDVAFREDASRICKDHSPHNLAIARHIALNLLKQERTSKASIRTKRLRAGWDAEYLAKVLQVAKQDTTADKSNQ
jgi:predicted transposase YbfD/YdcC